MNLKAVLAYVSKGANPDLGGRITGKRASRWQVNSRSLRHALAKTSNKCLCA